MPGMEAGSIYATAELDVSKFTSGAAQLDGEAAKIAASMEKAAAGLNVAQANLNDLAAGLEQARARMDAAEATFNRSTATLEEMQIKAEEAAIHAAELGNAYEQAAAKFGDGSAAAYIASQAYDEASVNADKLYDAVEQQEGVVKKNEAAFKKAAAAVQKYQARIGAAEGKVESLTGELTGLNQQLEAAASPDLAALTDATADSFGTFKDTLGDLTGKTLTRASESLSTLATRMMGLNTASAEGILVSKGLSSVLSKAAAGISGLSVGTFALGAGVAGAAVGAAYLYREYVQGAKAAREAQEQLNETVKEWNDNNVTTSFEKSQGMKGYGLSGSDFTPARSVTEDTVGAIVDTWSDGLAETDAIVRDSVASFVSGSDALRTGIENYRESANATGFGDQLDSDIQRLNEMDAQVEALLKKRQNGTLTSEEIDQLYALQAERESLAIKYHLVEDGTGGFDSIVQNVEAQMSRGANPLNVWADAYAAAAQGAQAYTDALNAEYDAQYKTIDMMADGEAKTQAIANLQQWYNEQVAAGNQAYAEAIQQAADLTGALSDTGPYADTAAGIVAVKAAMDALAAAGKAENQDAQVDALKQLDAALDGMDETSVVELTAGLVSMSEAGATMSEGMTAAQQALTGIKELMSGSTDLFPEDTFSSLNSLFGEGLDSEVLEISATLNTEGLEAVYSAWASGSHADIIPSIDQTPITSIDLTALDNLTGTVTAITQGKAVSVDLSTLDALTGTVTVYSDDGTASTVALTSLSGLTGKVTAYTQGASVTMDLSTLDALTGTVTVYSDDGTASTVALTTLKGLGGTVTAYKDGAAVTVALSTLDALTGTVTVYDESGTPSVVALTTLSGLTGTVSAYKEGQTLTVDLSTLDALSGTVTAYSDDGTASTVSLSTLAGLGGKVTAYTEGETVTVDLSTLDALTGTVTVYDESGNPSVVSLTTLAGLTGTVTVYKDDGTASTAALTSLTGLSGTVTAYSDGAKVSVDLSTLDALTGTVTVYSDNGTASTVALTSLTGLSGTVTGYSEGEEVTFDAAALKQLVGNVTSLIIAPDTPIPVVEVPAVTKFSNAHGEGLTALRSRAAETVNANPLAGTPASGLSISTADQFKKAADELRKYGATVMTETATLRGFIQSGNDAANVATYIATNLQAMQDGTLTAEDAAGFTAFLDSLMTVNEFAPDIMGSIAEAMGELSTVDGTALEGIDADGLAAQLSASLAALQQTMPAAGSDIAAGVGTGMQTYDFSGDAGIAATNIGTAIDTAVGRGSPAELTKPTGSDVAAGLGAGMQQYDFSADAASVSAAVVSGFSSTSTLLSGVGRNFSLGLASGILAGRSTVIAAAISVAQAAARAVQTELQIQSPSRVMADFGRFFDLGFAQGIADTRPVIDDAVRDAVRVTPSAALQSGRAAVPASAAAAPIDYAKLAEAMAQQNIVLTQDGRAYARIQERNNYRESNARQRRIALGFGK